MELFCGADVLVKGLKRKPEYNGAKGKLMHYDTAKKRWYVRVLLSSTFVLQIKKGNLELDEKFYASEDGVLQKEFKARKIKNCRQEEIIESESKDAEMEGTVDAEGLPTITYSSLKLPHVRAEFSELSRLWSEVGQQYTAWFDKLPLSAAMLRLSEEKLRYVDFHNLSSDSKSEFAQYVPTPAGISPDDICLLPELLTYGPLFHKLQETELEREIRSVRSWPAFIRARADPTCFRGDLELCVRLQKAGRMPPSFEGSLSKRHVAFTADCGYAAAFDPRTIPSQIMLFGGTPGAGEELACQLTGQKNSAKDPKSCDEEFANEWFDPDLYATAIIRLKNLTQLVLSHLMTFRLLLFRKIYFNQALCLSDVTHSSGQQAPKIT
jgi:hypothetical protein